MKVGSLHFFLHERAVFQKRPPSNKRFSTITTDCKFYKKNFFLVSNKQICYLLKKKQFILCGCSPLVCIFDFINDYVSVVLYCVPSIWFDDTFFIFTNFSNSLEGLSFRKGLPRPPQQHGWGSSLCSSSEQICPTVMAGVSFDCTTSSIGWRYLPICLIIRIKFVNLCLYPEK